MTTEKEMERTIEKHVKGLKKNFESSMGDLDKMLDFDGYYGDYGKESDVKYGESLIKYGEYEQINSCLNRIDKEVSKLKLFLKKYNNR